MLSRKMLFHQGLSTAPVKTSAEDVRMNLGALWTPDGPTADPIKVRQGVVAGAGISSAFLPCEVVAGTGQVTVKPGRVVVQGTAANQGSYVGTIDQDEVRTVAAAKVGAGLPAAGQFKAGRVIIRIYDQLYDGGSVDGWDVEIHLGAAASSAAAAVMPPTVASSFVLRTFTINSAGAFTMGGIPPYTVPRGGILPVPQEDNTPGSYDGQYRDVIGLGLQRWSSPLQIWDPASQWQMPLLRVRSGLRQIVNNGQWTSIWWNIEDIDTHNMWSSTQPDIITCRRAGYYQVNAGWSIAGAVAGRRIVAVWKNGVAEGIARANWGPASADAFEIGVECAGLVAMSVGDFLQIVAWQDSGTTVNISDAVHGGPNCSVQFVRPYGYT